MSDFNTNDTLIDLFLFETSQLLEQLEQVILSTDSNNYYSEEDINEVFRIMHTIKGSSAMMSYRSIFDISHAVEDLFSYIRNNNPKQDYCSSLNDLILNCIDFIKIELEKISGRKNVDGDSAELVERIKAFLDDLKNNKFIRLDGNDETINIFKAVVCFEDGCQMENIRAFSVVYNLYDIITEIIYYPSDIIENDESAEVIRKEGFTTCFKTYKSQDEIYEHLIKTLFVKELQLTKIDEETFEYLKNNFQNNQSEENLDEDNDISREEEIVSLIDSDKSQFYNELSNEEKEKPKNETHISTTVQNIISVSVEKLDKLMDLVGELVIAEAMVLQNPDLDGLKLDNFQKSASQLSKITNELQNLVMSVRMVPLSATFHRMQRIVRDMSKKLNKDDYLKEDKKLWDTKILATDISSKVLNEAMEGIYSKDQIKLLPSQWRLSYFKRIDNENYMIVDNIKKEVIFRKFNLMNKVFPFRKKFHVIFCRNVMIYFDSKTRTELINKFYDILEYGGYLFIGLTESIQRNESKFQYVMPSVYRKI